MSGGGGGVSIEFSLLIATRARSTDPERGPMLQLESWFVEMSVATALVAVVTLTLLGREARQKTIALERQLDDMTLRVQHAERILQHSVTPEETSLLSLMKEINVSAASIERVLQARAGAWVPKVVAAGERTQPASLLLRLLDAEDLAGMLMRFVPPCVAARCGLTCHAACNVFSRRDLVRLAASASSDEDATERFEEHLSKQHLECVRPGERSFPDQGSTDSQMHSIFVHVFPEDEGVWTLERKLLHEQTPVFNVISFVQFNGYEWDEHSDVLTHTAETQIEHAAEWLARHPGIQLRVDGHALRDLPAALGGALAQARAVRVRKRLLERLQAIFWHPAWAAESAEDDGVRLGGYSEEADALDAVIAFYEPRVVGRKVRAEGRWPHACADWSTATRQAVVHHDNGDLPCSVVEISVSGFEPASVLAF